MKLSLFTRQTVSPQLETPTDNCLRLLRPTPWEGFPYPAPLPAFITVAGITVYCTVELTSDTERGRDQYRVVLGEPLPQTQGIKAWLEQTSILAETPGGQFFQADLPPLAIGNHGEISLTFDLPPAW